MGLISRTTKAGSGTGDFAAGTTIVASEANADLNAIYNEMNGAIDANNLATNAVGTAEIQASAVTTAKIADANVTTAKITDLNVTFGKLAVGASGQNFGGQAVTPGITVSNDATITDIVTFSSITTRGGIVTISGTWGLTLVPQTVAYYVLRVHRDATVLTSIEYRFLSAASTRILVPNVFYQNQPAAGSYVYKISLALVADPGLVGAFETPASNAGSYFIRESA